MKNLLLLILIFSAGLWAESEDEALETVWIEDKANFECSPNVIGISGSVDIKFGKKHFEELAIYRASENTWLFLVVGSPPSEMTTLMPPEELMLKKGLRITSKTTGFRWEKNGFNEAVFKIPGNYTVYNSPNLESEMGGYKCEITVKPLTNKDKSRDSRDIIPLLNKPGQSTRDLLIAKLFFGKSGNDNPEQRNTFCQTSENPHPAKAIKKQTYVVITVNRLLS